MHDYDGPSDKFRPNSIVDRTRDLYRELSLPIPPLPPPRMALKDLGLTEDQLAQFLRELPYRRQQIDLPKERTVADRKETLRKAILRQEAELQKLERFPDTDIFPEKTVILYDRKYHSNNTVYTYVAMKAANLWYLWGESTGPMAYDRLVDALSSSHTTNIRVATTYMDFDAFVAGLLLLTNEKAAEETSEAAAETAVKKAAEQEGFQFRGEDPKQWPQTPVA